MSEARLEYVQNHVNRNDAVSQYSLRSGAEERFPKAYLKGEVSLHVHFCWRFRGNPVEVPSAYLCAIVQRTVTVTAASNAKFARTNG
jgi:hypothetical protein